MSDDITAEAADDAPVDGTRPASAEITVTGPGVSITRRVDEATMSKVIALLFGAAPTAPAGHQSASGRGGSEEGEPVNSSAGGASQSMWDDRTTLGEFLTDSGAKTFPQKICAAGYFLTVIKEAKDFSRDEVKTALLAAREDMPANFSRDWSNAISLSFVAPEDHDPNRFYIPRTGRTVVESRFQEAPKRRARRTPKKVNASGDAE